MLVISSGYCAYAADNNDVVDTNRAFDCRCVLSHTYFVGIWLEFKVDRAKLAGSQLCTCIKGMSAKYTMEITEISEISKTCEIRVKQGQESRSVAARDRAWEAAQ